MLLCVDKKKLLATFLHKLAAAAEKLAKNVFHIQLCFDFYVNKMLHTLIHQVTLWSWKTDKNFFHTAITVCYT